MNRKEKRNTIRNILRKKGLKKKHTVGAFGKVPEYLRKEAEIFLKEKDFDDFTNKLDEPAKVIPKLKELFKEDTPPVVDKGK